MLGKLPKISSIDPTSYRWFQWFGWLSLVCIWGGVYFEMPLFVGLPFGVLLVCWTLVDVRKIFYLLLFCIPLSTHIEISNGLAIDLPSEPLMIGLMFAYIALAMRYFGALERAFLRHPFTLLLLLHLSWIGITSVTSSNMLISTKFFVAKTWYIVVFYFLAHQFLKTQKDIRYFFWLFFIPLFLSVLSIVVRHATYDFSFTDVFRVLKPFYTNHVIYASTMVLFLPYVWFARKWYRRGSAAWWFIILGVLLFFVAIQLSYRRAAILSVYIAIAAYYMIRFKLTRLALIVASVGIIAIGTYFVSGSRYLEYAPNFEKTISHTSFDNLLEATAKGEDISTMERVYRWVAGGFMIQDKPWMGFGPGNFYSFYKPYTVSSFKTYVSDNKERSGIHCYYLMILVEQGVFGFLIFVGFTFFLIAKGETIYHQTLDNNRKRTVMAALLSLICLHILLLINDMIETDKIGTIYFISIVILTNTDIQNRRQLLSPPTA